MTKLREMIGIAFVAMSLLTGFAVSNAPAQVAETELLTELPPGFFY